MEVVDIISSDALASPFPPLCDWNAKGKTGTGTMRGSYAPEKGPWLPDTLKHHSVPRMSTSRLS